MLDAKRQPLPETGSGILIPLLRNQTGGVLPLMAMGTILLTVMVGAGVDMARGYKAERRLQAACDAGALAGRRAVGANGFDSNAQTQAQSYFNANFNAGEQRVRNAKFTPVAINNGDTINATATGSLHTMMVGYFFNVDAIDLSVSCTASMGIGNSDIMFVLDNTKSMDWEPSDNTSPDYGEISRIESLKNSMKKFYDTVAAAAKGSNARIRFGFVPYANTVNAGAALKALDATYIADSITVPSLLLVNWPTAASRTLPNGSSTGYSPEYVLSETKGSTGYNSQNSCNSNKSNDGNWADKGTTNETRSYNEIKTDTGAQLRTIYTVRPQERTTYYCAKDGSRWYIYTVKNSRGRIVSATKYEERDPIPVTGHNVTYTNAVLQDRTFSTVDYKKMEATTNPVGVNGTKTDYDNPVTWLGCIQERETTPAPTFSFVTLLTGIQASTGQAALDLDIDAAPTGTLSSKWRPQWPEVTFGRDGTTISGVLTSTPFEDLDDNRDNSIGFSDEYEQNLTKFNRPTTTDFASFCPEAVVTKFATMSELDFDGFVDTMETDSYGTYHDTGLLWGARLSSPTGIFATNVNEKPKNAGTVSRHLIFMTDGDMEPMQKVNSMYGIEWNQRRVTGTDAISTQEARHQSRANAICEAIKARGYRLWVIAFGTSLTSDMVACASPKSSYESKSTAKLDEQFQEIAKQVGELRVTL